MTRSAGVAAALVVVAAAVAAGCSAPTAGTAQPAPGPASSSAADARAPKVTDPLDPAAYLGRPCALVPASVLAPLRYPAQGEATVSGPLAAAGPGCGWQIGAEGLSVQIILGTGNRDQGMGGLAGIYRAKDAGQLGFVVPAPAVAGHPAVFSDLSDRRARGDCEIWVGLSDDLAFASAAQGYQGEQDSCQVAETVAGAVVGTLKGA
ncbi:DUF3558 domain-containing protein [Amycolatopsis rhabdoformis]|uniref:DUF3558 domain-containing protein n=1 Tax=Amycolatopsis rhabdoformis TaxID=1448059 RepID=A0ABZ1IFA6_9PSEU|nr:DUF3558 domain-containing protein [Amycolatopsis rhabdoformis]WSE33135.1 DUF3558 domain-containing protein [Amycolatopsis rhabdoformis]